MQGHKKQRAKGTWDEEIPCVLWSLRTTPNTDTQETPFFLVHGIEAVLPVDQSHMMLRELQNMKRWHPPRRWKMTWMYSTKLMMWHSPVQRHISRICGTTIVTDYDLDRLRSGT
jgi:hypothetical protein